MLVRPTFEQVHGAQLKGDAVLLGEDVDGAAGLGQQVQVELQAHGGGREQRAGPTTGTAAGEFHRSPSRGMCAAPGTRARPHPPRPLDGAVELWANQRQPRSPAFPLRGSELGSLSCPAGFRETDSVSLRRVSPLTWTSVSNLRQMERDGRGTRGMRSRALPAQTLSEFRVKGLAQATSHLREGAERGGTSESPG